MDAGVFESAPVQSPPGSHHRPGAHHRDRNRVLSFPQNAGGTAEKESLVAFRASTELSRGRDSGRRPFLGAPSRLSSDRTGGSVISTLEEKDSYDVGGAKSDGHGGAESSCQKQKFRAAPQRTQEWSRPSSPGWIPYYFASGIHYRDRDGCLMHVEPNILFTVHQGAPFCRWSCER